MKINVIDKNFEEGVMFRKCSDANTFFNGMEALRDKLFEDKTLTLDQIGKITNATFAVIDEFYGR